MKLGDVGALQWLRRVAEAGRRNSSITFSHDGHLYALLATSQRHAGSTAVSTTRQRDGSYISQLTLSRVTPRDAGLYVCVVTGNYGLRSYRAASLTLHAATGQPHSLSQILLAWAIKSGTKCQICKPNVRGQDYRLRLFTVYCCKYFGLRVPFGYENTVGTL